MYFHIDYKLRFERIEHHFAIIEYYFVALTFAYHTASHLSAMCTNADIEIVELCVTQYVRFQCKANRIDGDGACLRIATVFDTIVIGVGVTQQIQFRFGRGFFHHGNKAESFGLHEFARVVEFVGVTAEGDRFAQLILNVQLLRQLIEHSLYSGVGEVQGANEFRIRVFTGLTTIANLSWRRWRRFAVAFIQWILQQFWYFASFLLQIRFALSHWFVEFVFDFFVAGGMLEWFAGTGRWNGVDATRIIHFSLDRHGHGEVNGVTIDRLQWNNVMNKLWELKNVIVIKSSKPCSLRLPPLIHPNPRWKRLLKIAPANQSLCHYWSHRMSPVNIPNRGYRCKSHRSYRVRW